MLKTIKINENITLNYIPMDKLKTTSISLYIHRRLCRSNASKNAILPHILKRGCKLCRNSEEVAKYLDNMYGAKFSAGIAKRGDDHILCFDFETISDKYAPNGENLTDGIINLMMSVVFDTLDEFDENTFMQEKTNSIQKIKSIINEKRVYANYRCQEEMAKGDVYEVPRLGYEEQMRKLTAAELYGYYKEIILNSPIDIYICGCADTQHAEETIKRAVEKFDFVRAEMPVSGLLHKNTPVKNITEKMDVTQGKLSMGFLTEVGAKDSDYFALAAANSIFGGGAQSKLFNNVREKLSLCYYAGSFIDKYKGFLMVNAGIEFKNFEKAYNEIIAQLEEMKKGNITEQEFNSSKGFLINSLNAYYDDQHGLISFSLGEKISGTGYTIEEYKQGIEKVTIDDVKNVISKVRLDTVYFLTGKEEQ